MNCNETISFQILNELQQYQLIPEVLQYIQTTLYEDLSRTEDNIPVVGNDSLNSLLETITNNINRKDVSEEVRYWF